MDIAALNKRVTFQKYQIVTDDYGNHQNTWMNDFSCFATIDGESGSEVNEAGLVIEKPTFSVTTRYCKGTRAVTTLTYRIVIDGVAYNIDSVDHMNFKGHSIKFHCRKEPVHEQ